MNSSCVIGLDLGTTSAKAVVFNQQHEVLATFAEAVETIRDEQGAALQRPDEIAKASTGVLVKAARFAEANGYVVKLVGYSAAMHSLIAIDKQDRPLTMASIWMDARPNQDAMQLRSGDEWQALYEATGTPVHAMSPLAKLLWFRREQPNLFASAARFVSLKEYVWAQWFGEWVIDESMAGATGLYCMETRDWDEAALSRTGIERQQLSRIVPTTYVRSNPCDSTLKEIGLSDTTFNIGASDGVLANLGVGAVDASSMVLTLGTSCAVRLTTERPLTDLLHQPFSYVLDGHHYVVGGPSNSGGVIVDWAANEVLSKSKASGETDLGQLFLEAAEVETGDLICLPYAAGERAPLWNAQWKGAWIGLGLQHRRAHLFRATLEGILLNAYWIAESLLASGHKPQQLIASGKLLEEPFVRQLCADIFNLPVIGCDGGDASARGAAMLAMMATGAIQMADVAVGMQTNRTLPDPQRNAAYMGKYQKFRALCEVLGPIMTASLTAE